MRACLGPLTRARRSPAGWVAPAFASLLLCLVGGVVAYVVVAIADGGPFGLERRMAVRAAKGSAARTQPTQLTTERDTLKG